MGERRARPRRLSEGPEGPTGLRSVFCGSTARGPAREEPVAPQSPARVLAMTIKGPERLSQLSSAQLDTVLQTLHQAPSRTLLFGQEIQALSRNTGKSKQRTTVPASRRSTLARWGRGLPSLGPSGPHPEARGHLAPGGRGLGKREGRVLPWPEPRASSGLVHPGTCPTSRPRRRPV